jgi:alpha-tubulin suppressor-like RCC1 family protein
MSNPTFKHSVFGAFSSALILMALTGCGSSAVPVQPSAKAENPMTLTVAPPLTIPALGDSGDLSSLATVNTPWSNGKVASGLLHTCLIKDGAVWCSGKNDSGQLGRGGDEDSAMLMKVYPLNTGSQAIAAGGNHTCALDSLRGLWCWGNNQYGQLGDGTTTNRLAPVRVSGLSSGVKAIALGYQHSCAVDYRGSLRCWGRNTFGQLGDGTIKDRKLPVLSSYFSGGVKALALGQQHSCATDSNNKLFCWGYNGQGALGDATVVDRRVATLVQGLPSRIVSVSLGSNHTCAVDAEAKVWCWGANQMGQLGDSLMTDSFAKTPVAVTGLKIGARALSAGVYHTCISDGLSAQCWGNDGYNQLGLTGFTTFTNSDPSPLVRDVRGPVTDLAAGGYHSCVLDESVYHCWGSNSAGQLATDGFLQIIVDPVHTGGIKDIGGIATTPTTLAL